MSTNLNNYTSEWIDQTMLLQATIVRDDDNIASDMGGEKVILSVKNGKYYNLGVMGGQIWELIQQPIVVGQLIESITEQYDVDHITCEAQLLPFLQHLTDEKLIQMKR